MTWLPGGRIGWISLTSCSGLVPDLAATSIESTRPTLRKIRWAVGSEKIAIVAPPSDDTPANLAVPAIWNV